MFMGVNPGFQGQAFIPETLDRIARFGEDVLGKGIVNAKDTPNFIANRIGTFGMGAVFRNMAKTGLALSVMKHGVAGDSICVTRGDLDAFDPAGSDVSR